MLQCNQRFVRVFQRKLLHMRAYGNSGSFRQKLTPIIARIIRNAADGSFAVDQRILKRRDRAHVYSAEDQNTSFLQSLQSDRNQFSGRSKNYRRIQFCRRLILRAANPLRAEFGSQRLMPLTIARANINLRASCSGELNHYMSRRAKAIYSQPRATPFVPFNPGQAERTIANNSRTQKRRRHQIIESIRERINERGGRCDVFGVTSVFGPAGELRALAKILATGSTKLAHATSLMQPSDAGALA